MKSRYWYRQISVRTPSKSSGPSWYIIKGSWFHIHMFHTSCTLYLYSFPSCVFGGLFQLERFKLPDYFFLLEKYAILYFFFISFFTLVCIFFIYFLTVCGLQQSNRFWKIIIFFKYQSCLLYFRPSIGISASMKVRGKYVILVLIEFLVFSFLRYVLFNSFTTVGKTIGHAIMSFLLSWRTKQNKKQMKNIVHSNLSPTS